MNPNPPPPPPPPQPFPVETTSWFQRNKKWAIPVGCVGLVIILGCCGLLGVAMYGAKEGMSLFKEQAAAMQAIQTDARARIEQSPAVQEAVGTPVTVGGFQSPNYRMHNGEVDFRFELPVTGPKGSVTVHGRAGAPDTKTPPTLQELEFGDGEQMVDLLNE